jgi:sugar O-acyltransferase (sialic acid O-acetyltransferase NeuD family)
MSMKKIAIIGAGGFAREILALINDINRHKSQYKIVGFIDVNKEQNIHGYPIIGTDEEVNQTKEPIALVIAVGEPRMKRLIREKYNNPLICFPTLIHPSVMIGDNGSVRFGEGCIVCAGSILTTDIHIDNFVTINLMCTVGHDTVIKEYASFMPTCNISGEVIVNHGVYVGTGAKIINQVEIGENTIVGAGAVVAKSLPANCTAVGIPAKPIKFH